MSSYYIEAIVHQTIPCECVKLVEAWLLTRLFKTKIRHVKNKIKHDRFCFSAGWMLDDLDQGAFSSDGKLTKALAASRKVCPELCAEVEHEIDSGGNIRLGMIDHKKYSNRLFEGIQIVCRMSAFWNFCIVLTGSSTLKKLSH